MRQTADTCADELDREQRRTLSMIASGAPLDECLTALTEAVGRLASGTRACVLVAHRNRDAFSRGYSAHLPPSFAKAVEGLPIGEALIGTCGTAIHEGKPVVCPDVEHSGEWSRPWRDLCLANGIRGCYSHPAPGERGEAVGSFFLCLPEAREPSAWERRVAEFGALAAGIVIQRDCAVSRVTDELRAVTRLQQLSATVVRPGELKTLLQQILAAAAELSGTNKGNIQIFDPRNRTLRMVVHQGLGRRLVEHFAEDGWIGSCARAARHLERVVVEDVLALGDLQGSVELEIVVQDDIRSIQCTPLVGRDGRLLGMLNNHYRHAGGPDPAALRYIDLLARQAADLIERDEAEAALRRREEKFRTLVEQSPFGIYIVDSDLRIAHMNRASREAAFANVQPVIGRSFDEAMHILWPEEVAQDIVARFRDTLETGKHYVSRNFVNTRADKAEVEGYEWELHPITMADGRRGVICYYFDSTRLRETERRLSDAVAVLESAASRASFLSELSGVLTQLTSADALMKEAGSRLAQHLGVSGVQFDDVDDEAGVTRVAHGWYGPEARSLVGEEFRHDDYVSVELLEANRRGEMLVVRDAWSDSRTQADSYRALRIRSFVTVPFLRDGRWRFTLAVTQSEPRDWSQEELDLIREAADRIFPRLERARAEEAQRRSEERAQERALLLQTILDTSPVPIWVALDEHCERILGNQAANALLGAPPGVNVSIDAASGQPFGYQAFRQGLEVPAEMLPMQRCARERTAVAPEEFEVVRRDGSRRWLILQASPLLDRGQPRGAVAVGIDVTERKQAEVALRHQAELIRNVNDSTNELIYMKDLTGRLTYANAATLQLMGMTNEEALLGNEQSRFRRVDEAEEIAANDRHVVEQRAPLTVEETYTGADGVRRLYLSTKSPLLDDGGRVVGVIGVSRDITDRKLAEDALAASEAKFRTLGEAAPMIVSLSDDEGRIAYVSPGWTEFSGRSTDDFISGDWNDAIHPADRDRIVGIWQAARERREGYEYEFRARAADGSYKWLLARGRPVQRAGHSESTYWVNSAVDIDDLKRTEAALRQSEERMQLAMLVGNAGTWDLDLITGRSQWSESHFTMLGLEPTVDRTATESMWRDAVVPEDLPQVLDALSVAERNRGVFRSEHRLRRADDQRVLWVRAAGRFIFDETGTAVRFVGVSFDITALRQATDALRATDRRKDEFLAMLAHELRNPLAPLRNMLELLKRSPSEPDLARRAHATMERQVLHLVRLVDDLLDVNRITRGKLTLRSERVVLGDVLRQALEVCRPMARAAAHRLDLTLPAEPIAVIGDDARLTQVFGNLLTNACKFTPPGGHIRIHARQQGAEAIVSVEDTGVGIPSEQLEAIFEMFTQVDRSLERSQGGLGIGLMLVRRLVELHGGTVSASSAGEGQGSTFEVRLPVERSAGPVGLPVDDRRLRGSKRRILVVDDNRDAADSLAMLLDADGHETRVAMDGSSALALAESFGPDIVLLDIGMPSLNGYEVCRRIRQRPWGRQMMIIALTGWGQDQDRQLSADAGFDHHIVKPADPLVLARLWEALSGGTPPTQSGSENAQ